MFFMFQQGLQIPWTFYDKASGEVDRKVFKSASGTIVPHRAYNVCPILGDENTKYASSAAHCNGFSIFGGHLKEAMRCLSLLSKVIFTPESR